MITGRENFQKRPRLIEAYQIKYDQPIPEEVFDMIMVLEGRGFFAHTMTDYRIIRDGDWVIRDRDGVHIYPVSNEIFMAMYDPYKG